MGASGGKIDELHFFIAWIFFYFIGFFILNPDDFICFKSNLKM
ncbi:hypothetical protein ymoll0001_32270 [Yersinia mollaretii ATCC 43969]|uniref:Uncharacterized protein n=1 Tax=Yersinia mollaretii (strain ATCC 43969 / DSM 18520 / CIP 103324 / CNY 7263 / WAIP 204) TaxID=349967 RepID=A0ABM9Y7G0_YERMW|nr:hypothetical protein ymoll0001_32270 [Yersinia mollaretii ATCC 43969]